MNPVFGLIKYDGSGRFKNFIGHFHGFETEFLEHIFSHFGMAVMKCRQTMQKFHLFISGEVQVPFC